jgi:hypothetical protein
MTEIIGMKRVHAALLCFVPGVDLPQLGVAILWRF